MANISAIKVGSTTYGITATPTSHASTATTYGKGDDSNYGHVKLSDIYKSPQGLATSGIGASATALYNVYNTLNTGKCQVKIVNCPGYASGGATTTTIATGVTKALLSFDSSYAGYGIYIITSSTTINRIYSSISSVQITPTLSSGTITVSNAYGACNAMLIY